MSKEIIDNYRDRLRDIILNTCNTIGCENCDLKWGKNDCSATDLQSKIMDIESATKETE